MTMSADRKSDYAAFPTLTRDQARIAADSLITMRGDGAPTDDAMHRRVERFYYREARLLDEERFDEWYTLLADDLFYWMPLQENRFRRDTRPHLDPAAMALFDERKADIAVRLGRLASNLVWTEDPPTRHVYVIGNVEVFATEVSGEWEVHSTFIQYRHRSEHDAATLTGRRRDLLREESGGLRIVRRLILLPQAVLGTKNLSAFF
jgi:ethylbenzene dioxygenase beta subunit